MGPPQIKSKEAKMQAASNVSKGKKKKWSKGKTRDKANKLCYFTNDGYKKFINDVPNYKMISVSILSDRFNINGSLARKAINELIRKNLISPVVLHSKFRIFKGITQSSH